MNKPSKICGGYYIKSRKIQESEIASAPPHVREIWDWLLMQANYEDYKKGGIEIKRGQTVRSYKDIQEGLHWMVGFRKETYTKWQCEIAMKWLTKREMITTVKTTRGLVITICNYDYYQDPKNYENHNESHNKTTTKPQGTDTINKKEKKEEEKESKRAAPLNLEVRQKKFMDDVAKFKDKYPKEMLRAFYDYWSEPNQSKTKMNFELKKTFDIGRRLVRWKNNQDTNFGKNPMPKNIPKGQGGLPNDFEITVPYLHKDVTHAANHINKETGLEIKGRAYKTIHRGEQAFSDEQGRLITEQEYNEKKQLQTH